MQSRGPSLDLEKCVANMGNDRYMLVILASARAREIAQQNKHSERFEHRHTPVTALIEVENDKLDIDRVVQKIQ
jgi:DNA-directed RNA polymerase subunit K/omega